MKTKNNYISANVDPKKYKGLIIHPKTKQLSSVTQIKIIDKLTQESLIKNTALKKLLKIFLMMLEDIEISELIDAIQKFEKYMLSKVDFFTAEELEYFRNELLKIKKKLKEKKNGLERKEKEKEILMNLEGIKGRKK